MGEATVRSAILVDPHPLWVDAVEHLLSSEPIEVVGRASSLEEAQAEIALLEPDVVVAEIAIGGHKADGLAWLRRTAEEFESTIIVLTACADPDYIDAALAAGAWAYVLKTAHPDDLAITVRQAFEHSIFLPRTGAARTQPRPEPLEPHDLTQRELEILSLVAEGHSNSQLAKMLWVTEQTVKFHLSNVYRKLEVSNRTEASRWAQVHGLLPTGSGRDGRVA